MLDIKFVRENPEAVKENIKKKFQDDKLVLVDEVVELDLKFRAARTRCDELRNQRNVISKQIKNKTTNARGTIVPGILLTRFAIVSDATPLIKSNTERTTRPLSR